MLVIRLMIGYFMLSMTLMCVARFEKEKLARQDADDRYDTLKKKMDFQTSVFEQVRIQYSITLIDS